MCRVAMCGAAGFFELCCSCVVITFGCTTFSAKDVSIHRHGPYPLCHIVPIRYQHDTVFVPMAQLKIFRVVENDGLFIMSLC